MRNILCTLIFGTLAGCTSAAMGRLSSYGNSAHIRCYSGGELIYEGDSTGKVLSEYKSDGYFFTDRQTRKTIEVSADCLIVYE